MGAMTGFPILSSHLRGLALLDAPTHLMMLPSERDSFDIKR